jgi:hypothetical protein
MKILTLICAAFLLIALFYLPIGYYTFLRIIVTIGAIVIIVKELENGFNFWVISFGIIAILFNPLIPIYLNKEAWILLDVIAAVLFIIKSLTIKQNNDE